MLSIGKITAGKANYHQQQIAQGRDDYYAGKGEAPGRWGGGMAAEFGLVGTVTAEAHQALMAGQNPATGEQLTTRGSNTKVLGYDLTFSAPKSVSLVFAGGDDGDSAAVVRAHEAAVDEAMGYLEREACFVRRGRGGEQTEKAAGFLGARYRHRMSRLEDPQLHTHSTISSAAQGPDGRWTALHGRELYRHAKAAGFVYQAALRDNVRRELPWAEWGPVTKGAAELAGFDAEVLRAFSRRSQEIDAEVAARLDRGELDRGDSKGARERAALATRSGKGEPVDTIPWRERVRVRLDEHGLGRSEWEQLRARERAPTERLDTAAVGARLAGAEGLTAQRNTFAERDAVIEFAGALAQGGQLAEVDRATRSFLDRADVVGVSASGRSHTTSELLGAEERIIAGAQARVGEGVGVLDQGRAGAILEGHGRTLNAGQRAAFEAITTSGRGVDPVEALAGTGKTYLAGALREVYADAGYRVLGTAPTGKAVTELKQQAGVEDAWTLTRLAGELVDYGGFGSDAAVLLFDEAGMASSREAAVVVDQARAAGVKVIPIGDSGQLSSVGAGGALGALTRTLGSHELTEVVRQLDPIERKRLAEVHDGKPDRYLRHKAREGELELHPSATAAEAAAVSSWDLAQREGSWGDAVMVARDNVSRERLNAAARQLAREQGRLGQEGHIAGVALAPGDRIITRRNDEFHAVDNGTRGTVRALDEDNGGVVFESDGGGVHRLPAEYVADHVEHAYALTGHGSQGGTVRWSGVVGAPEDFTQNWAYTALSRGREPTRLFVNEDLPPHLAAHQAERAEIAPSGGEERRDALGLLAVRMRQRDDELLALEQLERPASPALPDTPVRLDAAPAGGGSEVDSVRADLAAVEARLSGLPLDELAALDHAREERITAERTLELAQSSAAPASAPARDVAAAELTAEQAAGDLARARAREAGLAGVVPDRDQVAAERAPLERDQAQLRGRLDELGDRHVERALERPGGHLTATLGARPERGRRREDWDKAARAVERYRFDFTYRGHDLLGPRPSDSLARQQHQRAQRQVERAQRALGHQQQRDRGLSR